MIVGGHGPVNRLSASTHIGCYVNIGTFSREIGPHLLDFSADWFIAVVQSCIFLLQANAPSSKHL